MHKDIAEQVAQFVEDVKGIEVPKPESQKGKKGSTKAESVVSIPGSPEDGVVEGPTEEVPGDVADAVSTTPIVLDKSKLETSPPSLPKAYANEIIAFIHEQPVMNAKTLKQLVVEHFENVALDDKALEAAIFQHMKYQCLKCNGVEQGMLAWMKHQCASQGGAAPAPPLGTAAAGQTKPVAEELADTIKALEEAEAAHALGFTCPICGLFFDSDAAGLAHWHKWHKVTFSLAQEIKDFVDKLPPMTTSAIQELVLKKFVVPPEAKSELNGLLLHWQKYLCTGCLEAFEGADAFEAHKCAAHPGMSGPPKPIPVKKGLKGLIKGLGAESELPLPEGLSPEDAPGIAVGVGALATLLSFAKILQTNSEAIDNVSEALALVTEALAELGEKAATPAKPDYLLCPGAVIFSYTFTVPVSGAPFKTETKTFTTVADMAKCFTGAVENQTVNPATQLRWLLAKYPDKLKLVQAWTPDGGPYTLQELLKQHDDAHKA